MVILKTRFPNHCPDSYVQNGYTRLIELNHVVRHVIDLVHDMHSTRERVKVEMDLCMT